MRQGALDDRFEWNTEENNARFLATGSSVPFTEALTALDRSRMDVVRAMQQLEDVTPRALEPFAEPAYMHVDDHIPELRRSLGMDSPS